MRTIAFNWIHTQTKTIFIWLSNLLDTQNQDTSGAYFTQESRFVW